MRTGRGLALPPAGKEFRRHGALGMLQIEAAVQLAGGAEPTPAVTVEMPPNVACTLAVAATAIFKNQAPEVDVR